MTGERLDLPRCDGMAVELAGRVYTAPIAGVWDLMAVLPPGSPELAGSLGLDIFAGQRVTIEPTGHHLILESDASFAERVRGAREVPARLVRDAEGVALAVDVAVPTEKGMAWMELDSGNGGTLVVGRHVAALLGLDPAQTQAQPGRFDLVGGIPIVGPVRVRDLIMDGNIGQAVLKHWTLSLDLAAGRAWIAPAP
jgi:hypothetical protein